MHLKDKGVKPLSGDSNIRPADHVWPLEALYPIHMITGLSHEDHHLLSCGVTHWQSGAIERVVLREPNYHASCAFRGTASAKMVGGSDG